MASTVYTDFQAPAVTAAWLNDVNNFTYGTSASGPVLKPDLAASSGAGLVGYLPPGTGAVASTIQRKLQETVSVLDFIPVAFHAAIQAGTYTTSLDTYIQSAVTYAVGLNKSLFFPAGQYGVATSITFPNDSFKIYGEGATKSVVFQVGGTTTFKIFDLSNIQGPGQLIENMAFYGPRGGGYGGTGLYLQINNGLQISNCWFVGLTNGIYKDINAGNCQIINCSFEFNVTAVYLQGMPECLMDNNTFYANLYDVYIVGACSSSTISNSNHIRTTTAAYFLNGVTDLQIYNVSIGPAPGITTTPVGMDMVNGCKRNLINGFTSVDYCATLIRMASSSSCTNNTFDNFRFVMTGNAAYNPTGSGVSGVELGTTCTDNLFTNYQLSGLATGVVDAAGSNTFAIGKVLNCTNVGIILQNADNSKFSGLYMTNNATPWQTGGTVNTIWLDSSDCSVIGLSPVRLGKLGTGTKTRIFSANSDPASAGLTLAYLLGDSVVNNSPIDGVPLSWVCVTAGSPGVWALSGFIPKRGLTSSLASGTAEVIATGSANSVYRVVCNGTGNTGSYVIAFIQFNAVGSANINTVASVVMTASSPAAFQIAVAHSTATQIISYMVERVL